MAISSQTKVSKEVFLWYCQGDACTVAQAYTSYMCCFITVALFTMLMCKKYKFIIMFLLFMFTVYNKITNTAIFKHQTNEYLLNTYK